MEFMVPVYSFFALRPAIFSPLFLFGRARRIVSGNDCNGQAMVGAMLGPRITGSVGKNSWCQCPSGVALLMLVAKSPVVMDDGQHPWIHDLEPCSSHGRN